jgi:hypothetical protein
MEAVSARGRSCVALRMQAPSADVVAVEARKADGQPNTGPRPLALGLKRVTTIRNHDGPVVVLPSDPRPRPPVEQYDQLLTRRLGTFNDETPAKQTRRATRTR